MCHCVLQSYTTICTHSEQVLQGSFRFRFIFWFVFVSLSIGPVFVRFIVFCLYCVVVFLLVIVSLNVSTSATEGLKIFTSKMTCYMFTLYLLIACVL